MNFPTKSKLGKYALRCAFAASALAMLPNCGFAQTLPNEAIQDQPMLVPRGFEAAVIYHNSFETADAKAPINTSNIEVLDDVAPRLSPDGLFGKSVFARLRLRGAALSPHRPLTISFWWTTKSEFKAESGIQLFALSSRGFLGQWLHGPANTQVAVNGFPGIGPVNNWFYLGLNLTPGVWHHSVAVFQLGSNMNVYTDGVRGNEVHTSSGFPRENEIYGLELMGGEACLDEVLILDRALDADSVAHFYDSLSRIRLLVNHQ